MAATREQRRPGSFGMLIPRRMMRPVLCVILAALLGVAGVSAENVSAGSAYKRMFLGGGNPLYQLRMVDDTLASESSRRCADRPCDLATDVWEYAEGVITGPDDRVHNAASWERLISSKDDGSQVQEEVLWVCAGSFSSPGTGPGSIDNVAMFSVHSDAFGGDHSSLKPFGNPNGPVYALAPVNQDMLVIGGLFTRVFEEEAGNLYLGQVTDALEDVGATPVSPLKGGVEGVVRALHYTAPFPHFWGWSPHRIWVAGSFRRTVDGVETGKVQAVMYQWNHDFQLDLREPSPHHDGMWLPVGEASDKLGAEVFDITSTDDSELVYFATDTGVYQFRLGEKGMFPRSQRLARVFHQGPILALSAPVNDVLIVGRFGWCGLALYQHATDRISEPVFEDCLAWNPEDITAGQLEVLEWESEHRRSVRKYLVHLTTDAVEYTMTIDVGLADDASIWRSIDVADQAVYPVGREPFDITRLYMASAGALAPSYLLLVAVQLVLAVVMLLA